MRDTITITDPAAASVFASPLPAKIVQTLIAAPMTMAALARLTETPMNLLHYHVSKCLALGLIETVHEQPRAGRALKHYRACAKSFFVPAERLAKLPGTEMTRQLREALDRNQLRTVEGVTFTHDGRHPRVMLKRTKASGSSAIELWLDEGLSTADAKQLIEEMKALVERYRARGNDRAPRHLVHLAAIRLDE